MTDDEYKKCLIKEITASPGVHMLENRLEREQSEQKVTDIELGGWSEWL